MRIKELLTDDLLARAEAEADEGGLREFQVQAIVDGFGYVIDLMAFGPAWAEKRAILALFVQHDEQLDIISVTD